MANKPARFGDAYDDERENHAQPSRGDTMGYLQDSQSKTVAPKNTYKNLVIIALGIATVWIVAGCYWIFWYWLCMSWDTHKTIYVGLGFFLVYVLGLVIAVIIGQKITNKEYVESMAKKRSSRISQTSAKVKRSQQVSHGRTPTDSKHLISDQA